MKKKDSPEAAKLAEIKQHLMQLTDAVCEEHLDEDYARLSRKLIEKLARKRPPPILRGRPEIWAAGVVYALGSANFLFDRSTEPYISAADLCAAFGVKLGSASQKATQIRDWFKMGYMGNREFLTKDMSVGRAQIDDMIAQMELAMSGVTIISPDRPRLEVTHENGIFIDHDHPAEAEFQQVVKTLAQSGSSAAVIDSLEDMIQRDPDYFDPYLLLVGILVRQNDEALAKTLLETAYRRAVARIADADGEWPLSLEWEWKQNRHLIVTFVNQSVALWKIGDTAGALHLLRRLFVANPNDEPGVRNFILGIRLGLSFTEYQETIIDPFGNDGEKYLDWFDAKSPRFPDEFDWWKEAVGYDEE